MHNIKDLRKNLEIFKKKFKDRNLDFNTILFNKCNNLNRELIQQKELLEQEKKVYQNPMIKIILKSLKKSQSRFQKFQSNKIKVKIN